MLDVDVQVRDEFDLIIADVGAPVMDLDGSPSPVIAGPPRESQAVARSRIIAPTWPNQIVAGMRLPWAFGRRVLVIDHGL